MADDHKKSNQVTGSPAPKKDAPKQMPKLEKGTIIVRGGGGVRTAVEAPTLPADTSLMKRQDSIQTDTTTPGPEAGGKKPTDRIE